MTNEDKLSNNRHSITADLTEAEFLAMVRGLQAFAAANPVIILERIKSGLGPPLDHRRDFRYQGRGVRVLRTEETLNFSVRRMHATHLSVSSLDARPLPDALLAEILAAFYPGLDRKQPRSILAAGLVPGELLTMPSALPGVTQYSVLTPLSDNTGDWIPKAQGTLAEVINP